MKRTDSQNSERIRETWLLRGRLTKGILVIAAVLIMLFLTWLVFIYTKSTTDQEIFNAIAPHITLGRTRFMLFITFLGNHQFLIPVNLILVAFFLYTGKNWMALRLAIISLGGLFLKLLFKGLFQRLRPLDPIIEGGVPGYSFPSGHALMGIVFYGFLVWWAAITIRSKLWQGLIIAALLLLILLISFSRIYLRVHFTTDILTGLCLGFVWLIFSFWWVDKIEIRFISRKKAKIP